MSIYFTSDLHFGHKNIIRYDNRPFLTVEEMDNSLIEKWNNKVKSDDLTYILGDVSWYDDATTAKLINQLNGEKVLIKGNHDYIKTNIEQCFERIYDYKEININDQLIVLCHYPIMFYNRSHYGSYMFYGHVHNSYQWNMIENYKHELQELDIKCNMFNVGTMIWNYEPVTFDEIIKEK